MYRQIVPCYSEVFVPALSKSYMCMSECLMTRLYLSPECYEMCVQYETEG